MLGCFGAIVWGLVSLMLMGGLGEYENPAYRSGDPNAPKPALAPTREEWLLLGSWLLVWLGGIALWSVVTRYIRRARTAHGTARLLKISVAAPAWAIWIGMTLVWLWWRVTPDPHAYGAYDARFWPVRDAPVRYAGLIYIVAPVWAILWATGIGAWNMGQRWFWQ
jgi:hypothetical protein